MADIRLFDQNLDRYVDALYAVFVATDEMQFFPEMKDIFGKEAVVKFLDIFAGQTIVIPPREVLEAKIRDVSMWLEICKSGDEVVPALAKDHNLTEQQVRDKTRIISEAMQRVGVVTQNGHL